MSPTCIAKEIPAPWRAKLKIQSRRTRELEQGVEQPPKRQSKMPESAALVLDSESLNRYDTPLVVETKAGPPDPCDYPLQRSFRIPGAMAIDPYMRALAQAKGMKVSDNAVWLLVIAMKEYTKTMLKSCIDTSEAVEKGQIPPYPPLRNRVLHKKRDIGTDVDSPRNNMAASGPAKCITSFDVYTASSSMSIGDCRSTGGALSRSTFERGLAAAFDSGLFIGGSEFQRVRKIITSSMEPSLVPAAKSGANSSTPSSLSVSVRVPTNPQRMPLPPATATALTVTSPVGSPNNPTNVPTATSVPPKPATSASPQPPQTEYGRKSPGQGTGRGRGAKDLAALRMRSSFSRSSVGSESGDAGSTSAASATAAAAAAVAAQEKALEANVPPSLSDKVDVRASPTNENQTSQSPSPDSKSQGSAGRRGMGIGMKNLAAMRARSITSVPKSPEQQEDGKQSQDADTSTGADEASQNQGQS